MAKDDKKLPRGFRPLRLWPSVILILQSLFLLPQAFDGDGTLDLLVNSENANWLRQIAARDGAWLFQDMGKLDSRNIASHDVSPTTVDWDGDGVPDFLGGAEDGFFYFLRNSRSPSGPLEKSRRVIP